MFGSKTGGSSQIRMVVEEYLKTSFESDCEYLDGEIVERNTGTFEHAHTVGNLIARLQPLRRTLGIRVLPVITISTGPKRYRVADIAVWRNDEIGRTGIPPFLVVEILSP